MKMVSVSGRNYGEFRHRGTKGMAVKTAALLTEVGLDGDYLICIRLAGNTKFPKGRPDDLPDDFWFLKPDDEEKDPPMPGVIKLVRYEGKRTWSILLWQQDGMDEECVRSALEAHSLVFGERNGILGLVKFVVRDYMDVRRRAQDNAICHLILREAVATGRLCWSDQEVSTICWTAVSEAKADCDPVIYQNTYFRRHGNSRYLVMNEALWSRWSELATGCDDGELMVELAELQTIFTTNAVEQKLSAEQEAERCLKEAGELEESQASAADTIKAIRDKIEALQHEIEALEVELAAKTRSNDPVSHRIEDLLNQASDAVVRGKAIDSILRAPEARQFAEQIAAKKRQRQAVGRAVDGIADADDIEQNEAMN